MKYIVQPIFAAHAHMPGVIPGKTYLIQAVHSKMLASTRRGTIVVEQRDWAEQTRQQWRIEPLSGDDQGYYRIVSIYSGKVLDVEGESSKQGARVIEWNWHGGPNQQWAVEHLGSGVFCIRARHSGQVLDVEMASMQAGANLIQFDWHGGDNQRWTLSTVAAPEELYGFDSRITLYADTNYSGQEREIGIGSYASALDLLGGSMFRSLRVPEGLRLTLFSEPNFQGDRVDYGADTPDIGEWPGQSSVMVEAVATVYDEKDYQGRSQDLPVGRYTAQDLVFGDNTLRSLKVPSGMIVYLYDNSDFTGQVRVFTESAPYVLDDFSQIVSGVIVKMAGVVIPTEALKFGDKIALQSPGSYFLAAASDGTLQTRPTLTHRAEFTLVRVGASKLRSYVSYGDPIALRSADGFYVVFRPDGEVAATEEVVSDQAIFTIQRSGSSIHNSFVSINDTISLSIANSYLIEAAGSTVRGDAVAPGGGGQWKVHAPMAAVRHCPEAPPSRVQVNDTARVTYSIRESLHLRDAPMGKLIGKMEEGTILTIVGGPECQSGYTWWQVRTADGRTGWCAEGGGSSVYYFIEPFDPSADIMPPGDNLIPPLEGTATCVSEVCGGDVCGMEACGVDICGAAVCGMDALLIGFCGAAVSGLAVCGADAAGIAACGVAACGAAAGGITACGADACAGAACAVAACGGALCGFAACGTDVCGGAVFCAAEACATAACGADVCAAEIEGADVCGAEACAAAACAAEACAADVCGAEACAAEACAAEACPVEACGADACAANVCALNLCPADACAADACALDIIPIIPGI